MSAVLLGFYKAIEDSSLRMIDAAKAEDWEGVMRFEGACAVLIEQLRFHANTEVLDDAARMEKSRIMLRILNNDAQIRYLAEPWLTHFESKMEGTQLLH
jgi:flagellar protein FliT